MGDTVRWDQRRLVDALAGDSTATGNRIYEVVQLHLHPTADLAVVSVEGVDERTVGWPQYSVFDDRAYGLPVEAGGFPEDVDIGTTSRPARMFKGHVQRFVDWRSHLGYHYLAAELSLRCPAGSSGGPLYNPEFQGRLYGVITENTKKTNILDSIEEVQKDGAIYKEHYASIIYYGVALWLYSTVDWLDSLVPLLTNDELTRRGQVQQELNESDRASHS